MADGDDVSDNFTGKREGFDPNYGLGSYKDGQRNGDPEEEVPMQTFRAD